MAERVPSSPDEARRLLNALRNVNASLEPDRVLARICEEGARVVDADHARVLLGSPADGLRVAATYGGSATVIGQRVEAGEGAAGRALERDAAVRAGSSLAVPMRWDGQLRGALVVGHAGERAATDDELAVLEAFTDLASAAWRNASAHAGLALAARTDALTGCLNHAAMQDMLGRELERCRRSGGAVALVILDLDDFKRVNELHGHPAGDELLKRVGEALRQSVRAYDFVARYGGDEFAIIAVEADERAAAEVAERALGAIGQTAAATAGVAHSEPGDSASDLVERADQALLHGKHRGLRGTAVRASSLRG
jgi:diguanylate cyclase (GGDEF)-like protein